MRRDEDEQGRVVDELGGLGWRFRKESKAHHSSF